MMERRNRASMMGSRVIPSDGSHVGITLFYTLGVIVNIEEYLAILDEVPIPLALDGDTVRSEQDPIVAKLRGSSCSTGVGIS